MKTNFHTHNYRCGHAVGEVEDYVKEAIKCKYSEIGISDHAPLPDYLFDRMPMYELDEYLQEIDNAKKKYVEKIKIYKSLEIEYFPEFSNYYENLREKLDYLLLGLHTYVSSDEHKDSWCISTAKDLKDYGAMMVKAIESGYFDIVAHPDLYMVNYKTWNKTTENIAHSIAKAAEKKDVVLEVNANGIRKIRRERGREFKTGYPHRNFWEIVAKYNVRVMVNSDCHDPKILDDDAMFSAQKFAKGLKLNVIESLFKKGAK